MSQRTWITPKFVSPLLPLPTLPMRAESAVCVKHLRSRPVPSTEPGLQRAPGNKRVSIMGPHELVHTVSNNSLPRRIARLSYFTSVSFTRMKSYQIQCHEQSQQPGVHLHLFLNIVHIANSPKIFYQISTTSIFETQAHDKKYAIHMSMIHFYLVH